MPAVDPDSTNITLQCTFAFNSTATGCLVVFTEVYDGHTWNITVTKVRNQASALAHARVIKSGNYSIEIYDIVYGACACREPAIHYEHIVSLTAQTKITKLSTNRSKLNYIRALGQVTVIMCTCTCT